MTSEARTATAVEQAAAVRDGRTTSRALVEAALARIEDERALGAYEHVRTFAALREADAVDARRDRATLPLAGVPVAIKDNVPVAGEMMHVGSRATGETPQARDHQAVARLRDAGAVVVGITRVPELCVFGTSDNEFGLARNPWNPAHTPGGSSGGAAAAVASGTVPIALGNDGMGSVRIPAACCGLVGLKPGSGVVPAELGNGSWFGMSENGPLATTVDDAALMLSVLAERPELASPPQPGRLRVAISLAAPAVGVALDPQWAAATREVAPLLREAGHEVAASDPPYGQLLALSELARWTAGTELDAQLTTDRSRLSVRTARHAALGRAVLRAGFPRESGRRRWRARAERFFAGVDVLVTPALARPPLEARQWHDRGWLTNVVGNVRYAPFAAPWNLAGYPAMSVPAGVGRDNLPLAVQLVAPPGGEARLLGVAAQLEALRPWTRHASTSPSPTSSSQWSTHG